MSLGKRFRLATAVSIIALVVHGGIFALFLGLFVVAALRVFANTGQLGFSIFVMLIGIIFPFLVTNGLGREICQRLDLHSHNPHDS